jgi:hypothetical protein
MVGCRTIVWEATLPTASPSCWRENCFFELRRVLSNGIGIVTPQKGQIPDCPAWKSLTFNLWPFGQKKRIPIASPAIGLAHTIIPKTAINHHRREHSFG